MMHMHLIGLVLAIAIVVRQLSRPIKASDGQTIDWQARWHRALVAFVGPPLSLLATTVAIVTMGRHSCHAWEGWLSYAVAVLFFTGALGCWIDLAWRAVQTQRESQSYPLQTIPTGLGKMTGRVMPVSAVFSAQVGLWSSCLVVSEGLLSCLDKTHLDAVFAHEAGHAYYRDTFWFFWLGGLRRLTGWLPHSESLWQELLLLREVRADHWATQSVDSLVLAESLMSVVSAPLMATEAVCAGFSCAAPRSRLAQRVDALLTDSRVGSFGLSPRQWMALTLALTPLLTIPFHHP
ncbi:MAG: M56 family metallopeptidase [Phormidesmis sp.]